MTEQGEVFDGALVEDNCTDIRKTEFSYNNAVFLQGAAFMYNHVSLSRLSSGCVCRWVVGSARFPLLSVT